MLPELLKPHLKVCNQIIRTLCMIGGLHLVRSQFHINIRNLIIVQYLSYYLFLFLGNIISIIPDIPCLMDDWNKTVTVFWYAYPTPATYIKERNKDTPLLYLITSIFFCFQIYQYPPKNNNVNMDNRNPLLYLLPVHLPHSDPLWQPVLISHYTKTKSNYFSTISYTHFPPSATL